jgi:cysteine desulfurase
MDNPIYLDYASTTPVLPEVLEAMLPYFSEHFGNAASKHQHGKIAEKAVDQARSQLAALVNCDKEEIVFTSGATEAINLALKGFYFENASKGQQIITVKTEHKAVLDTCTYLESVGAEITYLNVNSEGFIDLNELEEAIRPDTLLVAIMFVNNEIGVIQPMEAISELCSKNDCLFFTDATQAVGKVPVDFQTLNLGMMCLSAHKFGGPKGAGALIVKSGIELVPLIHGGGHENGFRSGTLNVPGIVGLGKAAEVSSEIEQKLTAANDAYKRLLVSIEASEGVSIVGPKDTKMRSPYIISLALKDQDADVFIEKHANEFSLSTGSACNARILEPSHVMTALFDESKLEHGTIRSSFFPRDSNIGVDQLIMGIS